MALTKLTTDLIEGSLGTDWVSTIQTSNFTAVAGKGYFVNTTSAEITVTLPAGVVGTEIVIQDYAGTFATNKVIFTSNGSEKIQGVTDDFECTTNNAKVTLIYQDATKGWTADNIEAGVPPLTVDYLIVAGGGGGGGVGGGGGAGGYRTSYSDSSVSFLTLNLSTNYTVTIGSGGAPSATGAPWNGDGGIGANGGNSVFSTITSTGGGGGAGASNNAGSGGSGGGTRSGTVGSGNTPSVTPSQGNSGGNNNSTYIGGGGGGALQSGNTINNNGGNGSANSITGTLVTYAGGGGGGGSMGGNIGIGGTGGGAGGGANAGTANTGGGGGGGAWTNNQNTTTQRGGAGGSGVVILRYPNAYTITVPAGLTATTATVSTDKVTTFTSGTGNIQFN